jgi:hypothetical protein
VVPGTGPNAEPPDPSTLPNEEEPAEIMERITRALAADAMIVATAPACDRSGRSIEHVLFESALVEQPKASLDQRVFELLHSGCASHPRRRCASPNSNGR